jgi:ATP-dependent DNA ligase
MRRTLSALGSGMLAPMEARLVDALPSGSDWQFEPKWDGFRCLAIREGSRVQMQAKSGKTLARYFPEMVEHLAALPVRKDTFVLDGELAIPVGTTLDFEALQLRLHPAESRIKKLAGETPAIFIVFDLLVAPGGDSLIERPLPERRTALESFFAALGPHPALRLSPYTRQRSTAQTWLDRAQGALDGVVAKRLDEPYLMGERGWLKIKRLRTADCVVGGYRYATDSRLVGSLLLGLYDEAGLLHHVGFTSGISNDARAALTKKVEALRSGAGFTGNAPGGPSRWSTERSEQWEPLKPKLVAEVQYDHITGNRFRHGTRFLRWRPDKAPRQCTFDQLQSESRPSRLLAKIV